MQPGTLDGYVCGLSGDDMFSSRDGITTIPAGGSAALTLNRLANGNFGDETSLEAIYGANAIGYGI
jgi:hypothetical protein